MLIVALLAPVHGADLQQSMNRLMANEAGAAVALDVRSGKVIAQYHIQVAAQRLVRPGSTVKPFTLLALMRSGAPPRTLICRRALRIGGRQMDCTHPVSPDPLDAVAALAYSCNYYFATLAAGLRSSDLVATFTRAGLTARTGLYEGEASGEIVEPATVETRQLLAIGESNILVTPLELVYAYRRLALDGNRPEAVLRGLEAAAEYGTARLAQPPGLKVAGKTGTALDPADGQAHAWFAGFAPARAPRMALVIFLERGVGGRDAAPIAGELFRVALQVP